jgi:tRNA A37 methylthiotransferase MiaB
VQERIADEASRRFVGRELQVLVEVDEDGVTLGRSYREGPDSDGEVRLVGPGGARLTLPSGRMVAATVIESVGVDLVAEVRG